MTAQNKKMEGGNLLNGFDKWRRYYILVREMGDREAGMEVDDSKVCAERYGKHLKSHL